MRFIRWRWSRAAGWDRRFTKIIFVFITIPCLNTFPLRKVKQEFLIITKRREAVGAVKNRAVLLCVVSGGLSIWREVLCVRGH